MFHHCTIQHNQATKQEMGPAECKQMTPPSIAGAIAVAPLHMTGKLTVDGNY